jgi:hypothetical protein
MGNTLRVVGIIFISMVLGLTSLVVVLFTACGGFVHAGETGAVLVGVALVVLVGGVAAIVWLARGIASSRPQAGLAVGPAGAGPGFQSGPAAGVPAAPAVAARREPLVRGDLQLLVLLRVVLAVAILASLAMAAVTFTQLRGVDIAVALRIFIPTFIGVLPPALALVLLLGNPPSGAALDLAIGTSVASVLMRVVSFGRFLAVAASSVTTLPIYLLQMGIFTLADIAIVVLALLVRRRVDTGHPGRMAAAILGFIAWEWLVQMVVMLAY